MVKSAAMNTVLASVTAVVASRVVLAAVFRAPVPSALLLPTSSVPALSVVGPLWVLLPVTVRVEAPFLVIPPTPEITPPRVKALLPTVARLALRMMLLFRVTLAPVSRLAPPLTFSTPVPSALLLPNTNVPVFRLEGPVKAVLLPFNVRVPLPLLLSPPAPLITPPRVKDPAPVAVMAPLRVMRLFRLMVPGALNDAEPANVTEPVLKA